MSGTRPDLILRSAHVVTATGVQRADVAILDGAVVEIGPSLRHAAAEELDLTGKFLLPGIIDAHVHFNEPGRTDWEGFATGSTALAAGGGTCFFDMPLNSEPPVLDGERFRIKRAIAERESVLDFGLWGGLTPLNLAALPELHRAGAIGLKAFMSASGIESFPRVDEKTLRAGMRIAADLGMLIAVHAEDEALATRFTKEQRAAGRTDAAGWLASRPVEVELAAIRRATELAAETRCALHVVHVSSPEGVALIADARRHGVDVTAETCPHYLLLNETDVARTGAPAKCAPPIRDEERRRGLWAAVRSRQIHTIGSDHSPAPPTLKSSPDFFEIWGGIAGCQHGFQLLLSACADAAERDFPVLSSAFSGNVAQRFRLASKGGIAPANDADFCVVTLGTDEVISADELLTRHAVSPYVGHPLRARVTHTFLRGRAVVADGRPTRSSVRPRFVPAQRSPRNG